MSASGVVALVVLAIVAASAICWFAVEVAVRRARPRTRPDAGAGRDG